MKNDKLNLFDEDKQFLKSLEMFNSTINEYVSNSSKCSIYSLYEEFNQLRPYYTLSYSEFEKLFKPFFVDEEKNIKVYNEINQPIRYYDDIKYVIFENESIMSSYSLQEKYPEIYRCVSTVKNYLSSSSYPINPFNGEIHVETTYEEYGTILYYSKSSWSDKEAGFILSNGYWVEASDQEVRDAQKRRATMEALKNCQ